MSAYVVDDITVNRIVAYVASREGTELTGYCDDPIGLLVADSVERREGLAYMLHQMNIEAVTFRYPTKEANQYGPLAFRDMIPPATIPAYKTLGCYLYQCAEGRVPENPLYVLLRSLKARMAEHIVSRLPEYEKAEWA